ncbi:MAG TPA: protein translocase subunit SecF [Bacillota bacterium]
MKARFNIPFMKWRRVGLILSATLTLISVVAWLTLDLNYSVDFTGGSLWTLRFEQPADEADIRAAFAANGAGDAVVQRVESDQGYEFVVRAAAAGDAGREAIQQALREQVGEFTLVSLDDVSPVIGDVLRANAAWALIVAVAGMLVYITIRFEWRFALTAVAGLVHDVLVVVGLFAVLRLPVDSTFVAAVLTIFGYSVNDTIIVYDRIRENMSRYRRGQVEDLVNDSVNQTLTRTINTGLTTLLAIAAIALLGGETTRPLSVALIVGIIAGTYSSIFIASALWVEWRLRIDRRRQATA